MTPEVAGLVALADEAAAGAAALLMAGRHDPRVVATKSSPSDVVTELDRASEQHLVNRIRDRRPDDAILGEEGGVRAGGTGVRWIVDPLDGTVNFTYGLPDWAVSVAVEIDGVVVAGVVDAPAVPDRFIAVRGEGAYRITPDGTRQRLHVGTVGSVEGALVATGFGYTRERRTGQARVVAGLLPEVRDVRRAGSAALDLCRVGSGQYDAYYERGLWPWDLAAGGLVAAEAGATVGGVRGAAAGQDLILAANPTLFGPLADLLASLRADED